jgi:alpha-mannosidase
VKGGRLEFVNGGWATSDEACASFEDILGNVMKGHTFLRTEFGVVPRVGWSTDTIDHSAGYARL